MTCATNASKAGIEILSTTLPNSVARCTSQAARDKRRYRDACSPIRLVSPARARGA